MTPTPEMIAMALRIAEKCAPVGGGHGLAGLCEAACFDAALAAIMETGEKVDTFCEDSKPLPNSYNCDVVSETLDDLQRAIRNGEHLR